MPGKKLGKKSLDSLKKKLMKIKDETLHDIKNMSAVNSADAQDNSGDVSGHAQHMADVATDMYDKEFALGLASNDRELLGKVDTALKKMDDSTFGACVQCKGNIPMARLDAIPYTETCLKCQEELEKDS